ncbi:putative reverse transcriptase domain-containing protein [Tanacetum coccineum]
MSLSCLDLFTIPRGASYYSGPGYDGRGELRQLVSARQDRPFHRRTALLIEEEARLSRAAWARSMDACDQAADRRGRRGSVITDLLKAGTIGGRAVRRDPKIKPELPEEGLVARVVLCRGYGCSLLKWHQRKATRTTRSRPVTATSSTPVHTTTPPTSRRPIPLTSSHRCAQLQAMIDCRVSLMCGVRQHVLRPGNGDVAYLGNWKQEGMNAPFGRMEKTDVLALEVMHCGESSRSLPLESYSIWVTALPHGDELNIVERNEITRAREELALLSDRMFPEETDKIERYVGGMPDLIYSSVVASKPKTMQEAIEMATELMDRRINTLAERQTENKRKFEDAPRNNQNQQPNKRQNTGRAYAAGNGDKKPYEGTKPRCPKCNFNHYGPCIPTCTNCKKLGHLAKDCRSRPATANNNNRNNNNNNNRNNNNNNNPRAQGANTNAIVCFECGAPGHFRKDCPQWKNKNQGNGNAVARAYAVGVAGQNPDNNVVTGTFLLNNRCASILFDTGADRSFVSTQFSSLISIAPTTLDHGYNVELTDGRII